jgi:hypothetical protein
VLFEEESVDDTAGSKKDTSKEEGRLLQVTGFSSETRAKQIKDLFTSHAKVREGKTRPVQHQISVGT